MPKTKAMTKTKPKKTQLINIDFGVGDDYISGIDAQDVKIPLMLLVHAQSKFPEWEQLAKADIPKPGDFYNPVTQRVYPGEVRALIIHSFVQVYTTKRENNRDVIDRFSSDGVHWNDTNDVIKTHEFEWKDNSREGVALKRFNYVILPEGELDPCIIRFAKTSAKNARKMNYSLYRMKPTWSHFVLFKSMDETNKNNDTYKTITGQVQFTLPLQDQELANGCKKIYDSYENKIINVIESDSDDAEDVIVDYSDDKK